MTDDSTDNTPDHQPSLPGADDSPSASDRPESPPAAADEPSTDAETDDSAPQSPEQKLVASLTAIKEEVQDRVRGLVRSKKALEQICKTGAIENLELVQKYTRWLRTADLEAIEMEDQRRKAVDRLDTYVKRRKRSRRMTFLRGVDQAARREDIAFEKLSESPLTVRLEPFTVEADFEANEATLAYARSPVATVELRPRAVLEARAECRDAMREDTVDSEVFFERLHRAYRTVLEARGGADGDRVDLVDLLAPLALYSSDVDAWRAGDLGAIDSFPRHLFAYQLARLRNQGMLEHDGHRIDLGTATGGSTQDKDDVLFIPAGRGDGQYYLSIRFRADD